MKASEMTIEEAIRHAEEVAQRKCDECGNQHQQLANWLKELVVLRSKLNVAEDALRKLQERLVASVNDGTIDPHEALKIAEDALAAIREEGGAKISEEMAKPNLCRSCANYKSDGCQICGCSDYEKRGAM